MDTNEVDQPEVEAEESKPLGKWRDRAIVGVVGGAIAAVVVANIINQIYGIGYDGLIMCNSIFGLFFGAIGGFIGSLFGGLIGRFFGKGRASSRWVTIAAIILGGMFGYLAYIFSEVSYFLISG